MMFWILYIVSLIIGLYGVTIVIATKWKHCPIITVNDMMIYIALVMWAIIPIANTLALIVGLVFLTVEWFSNNGNIVLFKGKEK